MYTTPRRSTRRIPPLNPLKAFEAAARHLSFTHAADELCVTQGAISRSVKALEDYFGEQLFERTGRGLMLTPRSEALAHRLTEVFRSLADATDEFHGAHASPVLTVRTYTSFMIGYLIPRLPQFQVQHPDIRVRLVSATDSTEFGGHEVDLRIRYGHGKWRGYDSTLLFYDEVRPVCSPKLLDPARHPYPVDILKSQVLLHQELRHNDWPDWLELVGASGLIARDNLMFNELSIAYQAAIAGIGVVMANRAYFRHELETGQLFEPFDAVLKRDVGYYLAIPHERAEAHAVIAFRDWLTQSIEADLLPVTRPDSGNDTPLIKPAVPESKATSDAPKRTAAAPASGKA
jgi:LysR family glycine cleavage system transcriptional activator